MKQITRYLYLLSFAIISCAQNSQPGAQALEFTQSDEFREGKSIAIENCISCHSGQSEQSLPMAPSLIAVKKSYLDETKSQTEFTDKMSTFLLSPTNQTSIMPASVEKYGLMPVLGYSKAQLEAVATFIYHTDLNEPNWMKNETSILENDSKKESEDYLQKGLKLALATKAVLGKNLITAIQQKGVHQALEFCNVRAIPLTDSMSAVLEVKIKRVSDKNRNQQNEANDKERAYILSAKNELHTSGSAKPLVFEENGKMVGYYPIITNDMCLKCHGNKKTDIDIKTLTAIDKLYPGDSGTGYTNNELRGIWVVEMDK